MEQRRSVYNWTILRMQVVLYIAFYNDSSLLGLKNRYVYVVGASSGVADAIYMVVD